MISAPLHYRFKALHYRYCSGVPHGIALSQRYSIDVVVLLYRFVCVCLLLQRLYIAFTVLRYRLNIAFAVHPLLWRFCSSSVRNLLSLMWYLCIACVSLVYRNHYIISSSQRFCIVFVVFL